VIAVIVVETSRLTAMLLMSRPSVYAVFWFAVAIGTA
jgi:hypothetical protein